MEISLSDSVLLAWAWPWSLPLWFLTCFRSEDGSVYRLEQPTTWQAYGFVSKWVR